MKKFKLSSLLILVFVSVMVLMQGMTLGADKPKTLRIGFLTGLTGFASDSERVHLQGAELARDMINEKIREALDGEFLAA